MARTDPQINLRIPAELKAKIEEFAKKSGRSTTAEIIKRLEDSCNAVTIDTTNLVSYQIEQLLKQAAELSESNKQMFEELRRLHNKP